MCFLGVFCGVETIALDECFTLNIFICARYWRLFLIFLAAKSGCNSFIDYLIIICQVNLECGHPCHLTSGSITIR